MNYIALINNEEIKVPFAECINCSCLKNCCDNADRFPAFLSPECGDNNSYF